MQPQLRPTQTRSRSRSPTKKSGAEVKAGKAAADGAPLEKDENGRPKIVPRSYRFHLPKDRVLDWDEHGSHSCAYMNTMSVFFPLGEQWFIRAVKLHQYAVPKDSKLYEEVRAFTHQESIHSREHELYNDALRPYVPVREMELIIDFTLKSVNLLPKCFSLGATIALEHLTATLGHAILARPNEFDKSEPHYKAMWYWHAHEEIEHKSVAFDVYVAAYGSGPLAYALRIFCYLLALVIFISLLYPFFIFVLYKNGLLFDLKGWKKMHESHFGSNGLIRGVIPLFGHYFNPKFHPWELDDSDLLTPLSKPPQ